MLKLSITQDDIDHGIAYKYQMCPVARSYERQTGHRASVVPLRLRDLVTLQDYQTSTEAYAFIKTFDRGQPVSPCTLSFTEIP